jgi:hypothetical protein
MKWWFMLVVLLINMFYVGFVGPFLISYADSMLVVLGFAVGLLVVMFDCLYIKTFFINKEEKNEKVI